MAEPKTRPTKASVDKFIDQQKDERTRDDCHSIVRMMSEISGEPAVMWGPAIIGFGSYVYQYSDGKELLWPHMGFSPRKQNITLYLTGLDEKKDLLKKMGKCKTTKGCLYIKALDGLHLPTLKTIIRQSYAEVVKKHGKA